MTILIVHKDGGKDYVCTTDTLDFFAAMEREGAKVTNESDFLVASRDLGSNDAIVVHVSIANARTKEILRGLPCRKALFTIDESKRDGALFRSQMEHCEEIECDTMVLTYPSERNIAFLRERGYNTISHAPGVVMRSKREKKFDVVVSGQMDREYYPTRTNIAAAVLRNANRWRVINLPHPGFERSKATHEFHGEKFRELLDECRLGVVCRAGWRDRLVAKYVEMGASWCLPVGDAPTYMNEEMKRSMVLLDAHSTEHEIVSAIDAGLERYERSIDDYVTGTSRNHNLDDLVRGLIGNLTNSHGPL